MPVQYEVHDKENYVLLRASGDVSPADWQALVKSLFADKRIYGGRNFLIDVSKQKSVISTDVIWTIIDKVPDHNLRSRWAIVVSRAVSVGVANMLSSLLEGKNVVVQSFDDLAKALEWMGEPG